MPEVYIVGIGMTPFGKFLDTPLKALAAAAVEEALADAGLEKEHIQAAYFANAGQGAIDGQFMVASHQLIATLGFHGVSFTLTAPLNAANAGPGSFVALNDGAIVSRGVFILGGKGSCAPP